MGQSRWETTEAKARPDMVEPYCHNIHLTLSVLGPHAGRVESVAGGSCDGRGGRY